MSGPLFAPRGPELLADLNEPQRRAVTHPGGPLLILAGAGSGKTRVITRRMAWLMREQRVRPWNLLAVTFTNKAAGELRERMRQLVGEDAARDIHAGTFHGTCVRILRQDIEVLGWPRGFVIYDDDDQERLLKALLAEAGIDRERLSPRRLRSLIDQAKNRMEGPEALVGRVDLPHAKAPELFAAYEARLRRAGALDFNDLVNRVVELFSAFPEVLTRWQDRFRHLLVDEYQDTNLAQYRLVRMLAQRDRRLVVVGDDDQSIYSFRGADVRNILEFERDFPDARVERLEQNYRSTGNILSAAMAVVKHNPSRKDKTLWTQAGEGERLRLITAPDEEAEGEAVAREVRALLARGRRPEDIAIIYRTNARSRVFETALSAERVPYTIVGARRFYERREVKDVSAYVRLVLNPADEMAFRRVVNTPARGVGDKALERVAFLARERGLPLLGAARLAAEEGGRAGKALARFVALVDGLVERVTTASPGALLRAVVEDSGYGAMLRGDGDDEAKDRLRNLESLADDAESEPGEDTRARLEAWLDRTSLVGQDAELPDGGHVTLLTCHLAKGLEYPVVFVAGLVMGSFPLAFSGSLSEAELEEERRLMYVALTRARERLYLTRALRRMAYGQGYVPTSPSIFLDEIPRALFDAPPRSPTPARHAAPPRPPVSQERMRAFLAQVHAPRHAAPAPPRPVDEPRATRAPRGPEDFAVGTRVLHADFGEGIIRQKRAIPGTLRLVVEFAGHRRRTVNPSLEPLEILLT